VTRIDDFANRVRKNARHLAKWARRRAIGCYRVYDRDIPEMAFALDLYGERAHLQEYERGPAADDDPTRAERLERVRIAAADGLGIAPERVVLKRRSRRRAGEQHEKTGADGEDFVVEEGGCRFIVNLEAHLDTGLFLDHRVTRAMVQEASRGKRLLNLFCYTGSFTVNAAAGGASGSVSVDLSNTYLEWARRNFLLNGVDPRSHLLVRADVPQWLGEARRAGERFDLVVLDPPSISKSKAMAHSLDVQLDHPGLIAECARLLAPGGVLYFSTNLQRFRLAPDAFAGLRAEEISQLTVPEDFRNRKIHRCWRCSKGGVEQAG
jgi:23S rRNA (guanine2069-N7)-methyltransferase